MHRPAGSSEPYLPLLDLLRSLCNSLDGARVVEILGYRLRSGWRRCRVWSARPSSTLYNLKVRGMGQQRMLREMAEAVEKMSAKRVVVLVLEGITHTGATLRHWPGWIFCPSRAPGRLPGNRNLSAGGLLAQDHPLRAMAGECLSDIATNSPYVR